MATFDELVELTPEQARAWRRLERAIRDFRAAGGQFYTVLETVFGYNGEHVASIGNEGDYSLKFRDVGPGISDDGLAGYADDEHFITFKPYVEMED
ncbi:hypothetical protein [Klebsiella pneumoniae]|uniref:hypothetical protein n=1 Tax=Klebsiella pneumoniae TaxID=573 RepID=UPI002D1EB097|nr:hypothetical protein [Klebsiella pneumoniae]MEB4492262.1 hypothetical protein [Klebsiella pneumoniae]